MISDQSETRKVSLTVQPSSDPRVGQNPTGRPRRSSAASRRRHARRQGGAA